MGPWCDGKPWLAPSSPRCSAVADSRSSASTTVRPARHVRSCCRMTTWSRRSRSFGCKALCQCPSERCCYLLAAPRDLFSQRLPIISVPLAKPACLHILPAHSQDKGAPIHRCFADSYQADRSSELFLSSRKRARWPCCLARRLCAREQQADAHQLPPQVQKLVRIIPL